MDSKFLKTTNRVLYKQLYDYLVEKIENGIYKDGDRLPSRREMSKMMNVSETTVFNVYMLLENTGYLQAIPRKGCFVKSVTKPSLSDDKSKLILSNGKYTDKRMTKHLDEKMTKIITKEKLSFSYNGTNASLFSRSKYAKFVRDIVYNDEKDILSVGDKYGEEELRYEIYKYLYSFRGIKCDPSKIILGGGSEYLLVMLTKVLSDDYVYAIESPGEMRPYFTLANNGNKVVAVKSGIEKGISEELSRSGVNVFYTFPSYHFPDGYKMDDEKREELFKWANEKEDRYIIEDDREFGIVKNSPKSLLENDKNQKVIYIGSFSRTIGSGFKYSYIILPDELYTDWLYQHVYYYSLCPKLEQYALAEFIKSGEYTKHCQRVSEYYDENRRYFEKLMLDEFSDKIEISPLSDSTECIVRFNTDLSGYDIRCACAEGGIKICNFSMYTPMGKEKYEPPIFSFGIGHLRKNEIEYGVREMKNILWDIL